MLQWLERLRKSRPVLTQEAIDFQTSVKEINIELSNYCNRSCSFCPRERIRPSAVQMISDAALLNLLKDLKSIGYKGLVHTHLYNEPLYDLEFWLKSYAVIREYLPDCDVGLTTNGDYMDADFLKTVVEKKVNRINATVYYTKWDVSAQIGKVRKFMERIGIEGDLNISDDHIYIDKVLGETKLHVRSINFGKFGQDRGGAISDGVTRVMRTNPCSLPQWQININYLGEIYPCCNIYPNRKRSDEYCMGSVEEAGIFKIYSNEKFINFREQVASISDTQQVMPSACQYCTEPR